MEITHVSLRSFILQQRCAVSERRTFTRHIRATFIFQQNVRISIVVFIDSSTSYRPVRYSKRSLSILGNCFFKTSCTGVDIADQEILIRTSGGTNTVWATLYYRLLMSEHGKSCNCHASTDTLHIYFFTRSVYELSRACGFNVSFREYH